MIYVDRQYVLKLATVDDQDPVEELATEAAEPALRDRVRFGRADRCADDLDGVGGEHGVESGRELAVAVADQVGEPGGPITEIHQEAPGALGDPRPVGVGGDPEQPHLPGGVPVPGGWAASLGTAGAAGPLGESQPDLEQVLSHAPRVDGTF